MLASNSNASDNIQGMKRDSSFAQNPNKNIQLAFDEKKEFLCMYTLGFGEKINSLSLFEYHLMHLN